MNKISKKKSEVDIIHSWIKWRIKGIKNNIDLIKNYPYYKDFVNKKENEAKLSAFKEVKEFIETYIFEGKWMKLQKERDDD